MESLEDVIAYLELESISVTSKQKEYLVLEYSDYESYP